MYIHVHACMHVSLQAVELLQEAVSILQTVLEDAQSLCSLPDVGCIYCIYTMST